MNESKYIIVVEEGTVVCKGKERRKLRHYKGREGQSHDSIAKEHNVDIENVIERGLILMGEVYVLECKEKAHAIKIQKSTKGTMQHVLEWEVKEGNFDQVAKLRPATGYMLKRRDLDGD